MKFKQLFFSLLVLFSIFFSCFAFSFVNAGTLQVTTEHPFLVNGEWIPASQLEVGDVLQTIDGQEVRIKSIVEHSSEDNFSVYNLEASEYSNFVVNSGDGLDVIVHNSGRIKVLETFDPEYFDYLRDKSSFFDARRYESFMLQKLRAQKPTSSKLQSFFVPGAERKVYWYYTDALNIPKIMDDKYILPTLHRNGVYVTTTDPSSLYQGFVDTHGMAKLYRQGRLVGIPLELPAGAVRKETSTSTWIYTASKPPPGAFRNTFDVWFIDHTRNRGFNFEGLDVGNLNPVKITELKSVPLVIEDRWPR